MGWAEADSSNGLFVSLYLSVAEVGCHVDQFDNPSPPCSCQDVVSFLAAVADHHREGCPCNAEELLGQKENKAGGDREQPAGWWLSPQRKDNCHRCYSGEMTPLFKMEHQNSKQLSEECKLQKEDVYSSVLSSRLSSQTHLCEDWQADHLN